eukprot:1125579-Rhodomonas_salina.1
MIRLVTDRRHFPDDPDDAVRRVTLARSNLKTAGDSEYFRLHCRHQRGTRVPSAYPGTPGPGRGHRGAQAQPEPEPARGGATPSLPKYSRKRGTRARCTQVQRRGRLEVESRVLLS